MWTRKDAKWLLSLLFFFYNLRPFLLSLEVGLYRNLTRLFPTHRSPVKLQKCVATLRKIRWSQIYPLIPEIEIGLPCGVFFNLITKQMEFSRLGDKCFCLCRGNLQSSSGVMKILNLKKNTTQEIQFYCVACFFLYKDCWDPEFQFCRQGDLHNLVTLQKIHNVICVLVCIPYFTANNTKW